MNHFCLLTAIAVTFLISSVHAADRPATTLLKPEKLITAESFSSPGVLNSRGKPRWDGWSGGIGEFKTVDNAVYLIKEGPSEKRPNGHEAVCEYATELNDYVLKAEFKLGTSPQIGFVCRDTNKPNHHQGRVQITPKAIWIQKMSGIAKQTRKEVLTRIEVELDTEAWHTITVEVSGDQFVAKIDDHVVQAKHERFTAAKGRIGFVARGEGALFRNVELWSGTPE